MKKEFTENELYEKMKFIVYCLETDLGIKECSSHAAYNQLLKESHNHRGDCTGDPCPCNRCFLADIEIRAQNIVDSLFSNNTGYCGKECLTNCDWANEYKFK